MSTLLRRLAIALLILHSKLLLAQDITSVETIRAAASLAVAERVGGQARAEASQLDNRLRMAACGQGLQTRVLNSANGVNWNVEVRCTGPSPWSLYVPVRVSELQPVLIAARDLRVGDVLDADAVRQELRDIRSQPSALQRDPQAVIGMSLRRPVAAGTIIAADSVAAPSSVRRGEMVTLIGRAGGFEVRANGKALNNASPGDRIAVENASSRRVVYGILNDQGQVLVDL